MNSIELLYNKIIEKIREGRVLSFVMDSALIQRMNRDFYYDTHYRVNNYHKSLKEFHRAKYGWELKNGEEFGKIGDRKNPIIGMEYFFFCASGLRIRE